MSPHTKLFPTAGQIQKKENPDLVYCNGFECPIGSNLYAALIRFRLADVPRVLWVDQLCINQVEGPEMAQQLLIMGDIYSKAERVLAWLGPAYDDSDRAMKLFPKLVDRLQTLDLYREMGKGNGETSLDDPKLEQTLSLPELGPKTRRALYKLFSRQYFRRVWTLQELAVSNDAVVVCGDAEFPFAVFERFNEGCQADSFGHWVHALSNLSEGEGYTDPKNPRRQINTHFHTAWILKDSDSSDFALSSARVLNLLRGLECSKSEDRVYSILRFLPPTLAQNLAAVKGKSTEALFIDLATFELTQNRSMDFLAAAGMSQHRRLYPSRKRHQLRPMLRLPTWVPDWTYRILTHGFWVKNGDCIMNEYGPLYQAAGSSRGDARLVISDDVKVLCVQVKIFDDIATCVEPFEFPVVSRDQTGDEFFRQTMKNMAKTQMMEYWEMALKNDTVNYCLSMIKLLTLQTDSCIALTKDCKTYDNDIGRTTACRQTLIGGMISRNPSVFVNEQSKATNEEANQLFTEWEVTIELYDLLFRFPDVVRKIIDPGGSESTMADRLLLSHASELVGKVKSFRWHIWHAYGAMMIACTGRRFFKTTNGFMGLAPDIAQVGDKVCLISGCCTPFIIRADGPNFCLVGESYVHGVMDGELMSDITFEDINLV